MSSGGGGGGQAAPTDQTVTQTNLPAYAQPYFERLMRRAEAESLQPTETYGGQRLAYFSPDELQSQAMTRGYALSGTPSQYGQAQDMVGGMNFGYQSGYQAPRMTNDSDRFRRAAEGLKFAGGQQGAVPLPGQGMVTTGEDHNRRAAEEVSRLGQVSPTAGPPPIGDPIGAPVPPGSVSPYPTYNKLGFEQGVSRFMSPYQQAVTDVAKREAVRQSDILGGQIGERAAQSGGLGGYREAILQAERQRNLGQQLGDIQTKGDQAAFESAVRQVGAERAADLAGSQFDLRSMAQQEADRQAEERFRQSGFDLSSRYGLAGADFMRGLGGDIQRDTLGRIGALQGIGAQQRALQQAGYDTGYQDFLRQQDAGQQNLGFLSNILRGVPVTPQQQVSTYQQQPGLFQSLAGLGLSGLGLYRGMGGGQG
tara:strand:- start:16061 stop:17329 length:1269 start_codon:yes stop_codon:yes gene_type:complete